MKTYDEKIEAAKNPNTPAGVLEELSKGIKWEVRRAVAENPNAPAMVLTELSRDSR